jgi:hypothetical protein
MVAAPAGRSSYSSALLKSLAGRVTAAMRARSPASSAAGTDDNDTVNTTATAVKTAAARENGDGFIWLVL